MSHPVRLHTAVPGPRSASWLERWERTVPQSVFRLTPIFTAHSAGATLVDVDGNRYIDFAGGIGALNLGANHPEVVAAVQEQATRALHTCHHVTMTEPYVQLCETLARLTPGEHPKKVLLVNSGAEAVENAAKIARRATGRPAIVALENAFHGRTLLAMTLTGKVSPYKDGFGPFAPEVYRAPFPYTYRSPWPTDPDRCAAEAAAALERLISVEVGPHRVAAVIAEPIQGEGGFITPPPGYFPAVAEICRRHGILFIADEIQTGLCRTGPFFCMDRWSVQPDLVLVGKSLAAGLPLAAVVGRTEIMDAVHAGGLGGTYGGNPLACAAACKVIEVMQRDNYPDMAERLGEQVRSRFEALSHRFAQIGEVRGLGAMLAMEMVTDRADRTPASDFAARVIQRCYENGLIMMKAGVWNNVLRFLAPLSITTVELEAGLDILAEAMAQSAGG